MLRWAPRVAALTAACGFVWLSACSSSTGPANVSLAGTYELSSFSEAGNAVPFDAGTLALTDANYTVHITFSQGVPLPAIADSGTYVATDSGSFSQTSTVNGSQATGTYTLANNLLTVILTAQGVPVTQTWHKQ
jgi:hypothetical protein